MGQIICSKENDQIILIKEMLLKIDETKYYQQMKTYKGLKSINSNLLDLIYRLYPKKFEDFHQIIYDCQQMKRQQNTFLVDLITAICLIQTEEYTQAEKILFDLIERYPGFAHPYFFLGNISLIKDSRKIASEFYSQCIALDPSNNEAVLLHDQCRIQFFDPIYEDIIEKPPQLAQEIKNLEEKAKKIYKQDNKCFQAFHIVSSNHISESSIKQCSKYLSLLPNCYGANIKKAQIYMTKYDFNKAIQYFSKAMELKPHSWVPLSSFAIIYYIQNELEKSLTYCNKIMNSKAIMNESNKRALQIAIKIKILCLSALGRVDESLNVCNTNLCQSNYEKDFLLLKNQILVYMEKSVVSEIVTKQIEVQMNKQNRQRQTLFQLLAYEKILKSEMIMNPNEVFLDLYFEQD